MDGIALFVLFLFLTPKELLDAFEDPAIHQSQHVAVKAKLENILVGELTSGLSQLTDGMSAACEEMKQASEVASRHTRALVRATWVLAFLTGLLVVAAIFQALYLQRHNKISVRPRLSLSFYFNEKGVGWKLWNAGLGPAEIRRFEVFLDNVQVSKWKTISDGLKIPPEKIESIHFSIPTPGQLLPVGEPSNLFWLADTSLHGQINSQYSRVRIDICYCSLYGECWFKSSHSKGISSEPAKCPFDQSFNFGGLD